MGKTALIFSLFKNNYEIINADSMQVYRRMDIGSAKPSDRMLEEIPHHLIDILYPSQQFNAGMFVEMADELVGEILSRGRIPVISGGTAFYFKSYLFGLPDLPPGNRQVREELQKELAANGLGSLYSELIKVDPARAGQIDSSDSYRILKALEVFRSEGRPISSYNVPEKVRDGINPLIIGLDRPRNILYERINRRVDEMFACGLVDEVKGLMEKGYTHDDPGMKGIGYSEFFLQARTGEFTFRDVSEIIKRNSRRYAKRQLTFFRKLPEVRWFHPEDGGIRDTVLGYLKNIQF